MNVKAKNKVSMLFFESPLLELLIRSHTLLTWGIFLPTSIYLLFTDCTVHSLFAVFSLGLFALSLLAWTLFEYVMHRYVFHFVTENPRLQRFFYYAHGIHHEFPRDKDHL